MRSHTSFTALFGKKYGVKIGGVSGTSSFRTFSLMVRERKNETSRITTARRTFSNRFARKIWAIISPQKYAGTPRSVLSSAPPQKLALKFKIGILGKKRKIK